MTEAIILGTVAIRVPDTLLEWEAEKYLKRSYRHGWQVRGFN